MPTTRRLTQTAGRCVAQMGKHDLALTDYNKALGLDQNYALAYLGRGQV